MVRPGGWLVHRGPAHARAPNKGRMCTFGHTAGPSRYANLKLQGAAQGPDRLRVQHLRRQGTYGALGDYTKHLIRDLLRRPAPTVARPPISMIGAPPNLLNSSNS